MFWVIAGLLCAGALALVMRALTGRQPVEEDGGFEEVQVFRAQLAELERDVEAGMVSAEDAAASRLEIERRLLRADEQRRQGAPPSASPVAAARRRMAAVIVVALIPVAAAGLYLALGHPDRPESAGLPRQAGTASGAAPSTDAPGEAAPSLEELAGRLEERLKSTPQDPRGWSLLGRTYTVLGRYEKAAGAYRKAAELRPEAAELHSGLGEALALAAGGQVTPEALKVFTRAHELDPSDAASRFYLGMADYQRGRFRAALDAWVGLAKDAPPDAPWLSDLRSQIDAVARQLGVDPKPLLAGNAAPGTRAVPDGGPAAGAGRRGPAAEDIQAAAQLSAEDRKAMIKGMVSGLEARLEENPNDADGWRMLARSWRVLGNPDKSAEALGRLARLRPDDVSAQSDYALALVQRDEAKGKRLGDPTMAALQNVLRLDGDNVQALFFLGKAEAQRGNRTEAEILLQRVVRRSAESEPLRKEAETILNAGPGRN